MLRTQVQLRDDQVVELRRIASDRGKSMAEVIREAVDTMIRSSHGPSWEARRHRALAVVGKYEGPGDLSERHDDYFAEAALEIEPK